MKRPAFLDSASALFSRLSRREKTLALGAGGVLVLLVALLVSVSVRSSFADVQSRIAVEEQGLAQVVQLSGGFQQADAERQRLRARLQGSRGVSLFSFMEQVTKGQGVNIDNMTPRPPSTQGGITEQSVQVQLDGITIDKLAGILNGIQTSPQMIKIKRLRVRQKFNDKQKVDATMTVATYSLAG